jgi:hypothetical protein
MARQAEDPKARINPVLLLNRISHRDTAKQRRAQGNRISKALTVALGWWTSHMGDGILAYFGYLSFLITLSA